MKPAPFTYLRPASLEEALTAYAEAPDAKVLAGGQSLIPLLSMRLTTVSHLIDINGIAELSYVAAGSEDGSGVGVRIGAIARHTEVLRSAQARARQPLLGEALRHVAHPTIRNRGTTVGSIVHADAAGEMPTILALLGGSLTVASARGRREIAAEELFVGPLETSVASDEIAVEASMPALPPGQGVAFDEIARRHGDYALCGVGAVVGIDDSGAISHARAGYVSMSETPTVVELTACFDDAPPTDAALADAGELALSSLTPESDIHASAAYRSLLARTLTARVVAAAYADAQARRRREEQPS